jgi:hypothetical protein
LTRNSSTHLSGSLLGLGESLLDLESALLLEDHNLEALEVGESDTLLGDVDSLGKSGLGPLLVDLLLLPDLGDSSGAGSEGNVDGDAGQAEVGKGEGLAGDLGGINQDL